MPLIRVKLIEGGVTPAQKRDLITKLTDAFVSVVGDEIRPITWVILEEVKNGDWGMGGEPWYRVHVHRPAEIPPQAWIC
jgi:4-oxalocrotonate tautomerase